VPAVAAVALFVSGIGYAYPLGLQRAFLDAVPERLCGQGFGLMATGLMGGPGDAAVRRRRRGRGPVGGRGDGRFGRRRGGLRSDHRPQEAGGGGDAAIRSEESG
jgi:hypothetical protein